MYDYSYSTFSLSYFVLLCAILFYCFTGFARHGHGVFRWDNTKNHDVYEGEFRDGSQTGFGVYYFKGSKTAFYQGEFFDGKFQGLGMQQTHPGDFYQGYWRDNRPDGYGVHTYADG